MKIAGLQKLTLIDYPGKLACTAFLSGCSFKCPWCYSPELVLPAQIKKQPQISEKEFLSFLKEKKGLLEGVVLCGGEPCINKDLSLLIKKIREMDFLVKLDTNGSNPASLQSLLNKGLLNYIAMDIKAPLSLGQYKRSTGGRAVLADIKKSIDLIKESKIDYEFRTTVVPGFHKREDILQIAKDISPAKKYFLQNFRPEKTVDAKMMRIKPYPESFLVDIKESISPLFEICQVR